MTMIFVRWSGYCVPLAAVLSFSTPSAPTGCVQSIRCGYRF